MLGWMGVAALSEGQNGYRSVFHMFQPNNSISVLDSDQSIAITSPGRQSEGKGVY